MDSIEKAYLQIILEAQYETDIWKRFGKYHEIEIYYNIEHVKQRLNERYPNVTFNHIRNIVNKFIKIILNDKTLDKVKGNELSFTIHCTLSDIWFSGRFKRNSEKWRVYISTLLPSRDQNGNKITPKYSANDYRKDIYA